MTQQPSADAFDIEDMIQRAEAAQVTREYNCDLRRLYPWTGRVETKRPVTEFGVVWVEVAPGTVVDAHEHDEEETFVVIAGTGEFSLQGQTTLLGPGDVAYVPRFWRHQLHNPGRETFVFLDVYWDFRGRTKQQYLDELHANA